MYNTYQNIIIRLHFHDLSFQSFGGFFFDICRENDSGISAEIVQIFLQNNSKLH